MKPCFSGRIEIVTFSWRFHQSFPSPPVIDEGAPGPAPLNPSDPDAPFVARPSAAVHGSVSAYAGAGLFGATIVDCPVDIEDVRDDRLRVGSGRLFCCASAATCSMLISINKVFAKLAY
jgi:hypothetical protein